jgi:hypothetical protein
MKLIGMKLKKQENIMLKLVGYNMNINQQHFNDHKIENLHRL